jgi:hypothetical protein
VCCVGWVPYTDNPKRHMVQCLFWRPGNKSSEIISERAKDHLRIATFWKLTHHQVERS